MDDTTRDLLEQIQRMATDTVVTPTKRVRNTMPRNASNSRPDARYTTELVPTQPLPHAAPALAAAEAGAGLGVPITYAEVAQARRDLAAERARFESSDAELGRTYRDLDAAVMRAEAAEAERDRLSASNAELSATLSRLDADWERTCATVRQEYEAERDAAQALADHNLNQFERAMMDWQDARDECRRLGAEVAAVNDAKARFDAARNAALDRAERAEAEVAALRGAMPDADVDVLSRCVGLLDYAVEASDWAGVQDISNSLGEIEARIRAALATATPTPPAAEAVTGGDTRRLAWLANELAMDWTIGPVDIAGLACAYAEDNGRDEPTDADILAALRRAIDTAIVLDQPQAAADAATGGEAARKTLAQAVEDFDVSRQGCVRAIFPEFAKYDDDKMLGGWWVPCEVFVPAAALDTPQEAVAGTGGEG